MEFLDMSNYLDPIIINAEIWRRKNCLVKIMQHKNDTKFRPISIGMFREIIKYAWKALEGKNFLQNFQQFF